MKVRVQLPLIPLRLTVFAAAPLLAVPLVVSSIGCTDASAPTSPEVSRPARAAASSSSPSVAPEVATVTPSSAVPELAPAGQGAAKGDDQFEVPETKPPTLFALEALAHEDKGHDFVSEGDALIEEGRVGEALIAYRHALYSDERADTWARIGDAYAQSDDLERAVAAWEASVDQADSPQVRRSLVRAYLDSQDGEMAREHAEALVKQAPTGRSQYMLGRAYLLTAMWQEAIDAFEHSLEDKPGDIFAHNNLGFAALQLGENELALTHLEHVLDLKPIRPYMLNNLGVAYERTGHGPEALAAFTYAAELNGGYVKAKVNQQRVAQGLSVDEKTLSAELLDELKTPTEPEDATAMVDPDAVEID